MRDIFSKKHSASPPIVNFYHSKFPGNRDQYIRKYDMILATSILENNTPIYSKILSVWISMLRYRGTLYIENKENQHLKNVIEKIEPVFLEIKELPTLIKRVEDHPMKPSSPSDSIIYVSAISNLSQRTGGVTTFPLAAITLCSRQRSVVSEKKFANTRADYWFARAKESKNLSEKAIESLDKIRNQSFNCEPDADFHGFSPLHIATIMRNSDMIEYFTKHLPESAWEIKDDFGLTPRDYLIKLS